MAQFTGQFAQSTALLASCEEHQSLARALAQLSEGEERIEAALNRQASDDYFLFSELIKDYIGLIGSVKVRAFHIFISGPAECPVLFTRLSPFFDLLGGTQSARKDLPAVAAGDSRARQATRAQGSRRPRGTRRQGAALQRGGARVAESRREGRERL